MISVETTDKPNREWSKFKQDLPLLDQSAFLPVAFRIFPKVTLNQPAHIDTASSCPPITRLTLALTTKCHFTKSILEMSYSSS